MTGHIKVGGAWKTVESISARVGGSWKSVTNGYTKVAGDWKEFYTLQTGSYDLLATTILSSSQASVTFNSLSTYASTYQHLQIRAVARLTASVNFDEVYYRVNGSSGTYRTHWLKGDGSSVVSSTLSDNAGRVTITTPGANASSNIFGAFVMDILDFASSSKLKTIRSLSGSTGASNGVELVSTNWYSETSAITSLLLGADNGLLEIGSRFSLYGLKASA